MRGSNSFLAELLGGPHDGLVLAIKLGADGKPPTVVLLGETSESRYELALNLRWGLAPAAIDHAVAGHVRLAYRLARRTSSTRETT